MEDARIALATLVADTQAWLDAWRRDGGVSVIDGTLEGLPPPPTFAAPATARATSPPVAPRPGATAFAAPRGVAAPPHGSAPVAPRAGAPPDPAPVAAPVARAPGAGLFGGRWAEATETPASRLAKVLAALPAACERCGNPPPRGTGPAGARLVVIARPLAGDAAAMFQKMLVHVLTMEPGDVWSVAPSDCPGCASHLRAQVDALAPRLVLAMGDPARIAVGLAARGVWGRWAGADALATHHPDEVLAQLAAGGQEARRATFEHLKELARRV
jgi:uracil-DNA glycosylase